MTGQPAARPNGGGFAATAASVLGLLGPAATRQLADRIETGAAPALILHGLGARELGAVSRMLTAKDSGDLPDSVAAAYLQGLAAGYARQEARCEIEVVWSGPTTHRVPVRATEQALVSVIASATRELVLMTYSATPNPPITEALEAAASRDVVSTVVVETLQGAGSAISGAEPAAAFAGIPRLELWHWPASKRPDASAKQHAKLAIADARFLFVTSANLTVSGISRNIEAGLLVDGGTAPQRAAEHIRGLQANGVLARLL